MDRHEHSQSEMFAGTGGTGVKNMPSEHSKIMPGKCVTCHMNREEGDEVLKNGGHTFRKDSRVCLKCHKAPETIVKEWRDKVSPLLKELKSLLDKIPDKDKAAKFYKDASLNYDIVIADRGMGSHNPRYAQALLGHSIASLKFRLEEKK